MARHQTGDKPWHDSTFIKFRNTIWHHQTSDVKCTCYKVTSNVKHLTFTSIYLNLSYVCFCQSRLSYVINSMAADVLTTQGARSSAAMVLAGFSWNIPVSAPEELIVIFHFIFNTYGSVFLFIANRCPCHS